jgi:predicted RNA-binding Zn ribbon-like protein
LLQEFVNTNDQLARRDAIANPAELSTWLTEHGLIERDTAITPSDHERALAAREAVRMFLSRDRGRPSELEIALLDEVGRRARLQWSFTADGTVALVARAGGLMGALGTILAPLLSAAVTGSLERMKTCRNCRWVFYDYSKNRSATWCSMAVCGSRAKARRHYWRSRRRESPEHGTPNRAATDAGTAP